MRTSMSQTIRNVEKKYVGLSRKYKVPIANLLVHALQHMKKDLDLEDEFYLLEVIKKRKVSLPTVDFTERSFRALVRQRYLRKKRGRFYLRDRATTEGVEFLFQASGVKHTAIRRLSTEELIEKMHTLADCWLKRNQYFYSYQPHLLITFFSTSSCSQSHRK